MKKIVIPFIFVALLFFQAMAAEPVKIPYAQAIDLAACPLAALELEERIEELEELQQELRDEIRRFSRGGIANEMTAALLYELDMLHNQIFNTFTLQGQLQENAEQQIQRILQGLQDPVDANDFLGQTIDSVFRTMLTQQNIVGSMAMMQNRVEEIFDELAMLQEYSTTRSLLDEATRTMRELDESITYQLFIIRLQQEQSRLGLENTVRLHIFAVVELEDSIQTLETALAITRENLRRVTVRHNLGLASAGELRRAQQAVTLEELTISQRRTSLENALNSLNLLLNQPLYQNTVVVFERGEVGDLGEYIYEIPNTPQIRQLQRYVDEAHADVRAFRGSDREARAAVQEAYRRAVERRENAIHTMEAAFRRTLNDFANLQTLLDANELEVYAARLALDTAQTNLSLGRVTRHEVEQAKVAIFRLTQARESIYNQKWLMAFRLQNPALL